MALWKIDMPCILWHTECEEDFSNVKVLHKLFAHSMNRSQKFHTFSKYQPHFVEFYSPLSCPKVPHSCHHSESDRSSPVCALQFSFFKTQFNMTPPSPIKILYPFLLPSQVKPLSSPILFAQITPPEHITAQHSIKYSIHNILWSSRWTSVCNKEHHVVATCILAFSSHQQKKKICPKST